MQQSFYNPLFFCVSCCFACQLSLFCLFHIHVSFQKASDLCGTKGDVIAMVTPTLHCTQQTFRQACLQEAKFNPLPCRSALVKPTLLAQKEHNKQNRAERKTRVKVSEGPTLLVLKTWTSLSL